MSQEKTTDTNIAAYYKEITRQTVAKYRKSDKLTEQLFYEALKEHFIKAHEEKGK